MSEKLYCQEGETLTEYTPEQYAQHAKDLAEIAARKAAAEATEAAKAALLVKLGLTADEAKVLLG